MLVGIGRKFSREDPKIPALPCDIFFSSRNTSVLYRFGGRLSGPPFFNFVLGVKVAVEHPSLLPALFWDDFIPKLGQASLACAVRSVTGRVVLQSVRCCGAVSGAVGLWGLCDIVASSVLVLLAWPKLLGFSVCSW